MRPQSFHQTARKLDCKGDFDISDRKRIGELLSPLEIAIGLAFGNGATLGEALGGLGQRTRTVQQDASPIEPLGLLNMRGTGQWKLLKKMVGAPRFELGTSWSRS